MSTSPDENVTTVVVKTGPGSIYVKIVGASPPADQVGRLLRERIDRWFSAHPRFVMERTRAFVDRNGTILGIQARYHETDTPDRLTMANAQEPPISMTIEVNRAVAARFSNEYIEAVIDDAMQISNELRDRKDTLVVINPRRIAAILDRRSARGSVIPVESVERVIDGPMKARPQAWLANPENRYYLMHIDQTEGQMSQEVRTE